ncbi:uncharacterized protein LOC121305544 isoform X1 [Polyodon spathula]|uniref:uncharacterized protein LOC121305544 isoform X1 n=1 Tax=Polyodon spathula TaxID=7913 RepID=UPI001B7F6C95|nr:uncharacterized protein LOC121305544 isoform X1 [Polyodon spathula]
MRSLLIIWTLVSLPAIDSSSVIRANVTRFCSGEVMVYRDGQLGALCGDGWTMSGAQFVCRELGCGKAESAPVLAKSGEGDFPGWVYNTTCTGSESFLDQCLTLPLKGDSCRPEDHAGVVCSDSSKKPDLAVSLVKSGELSLQCVWPGEWHNKNTFILLKNKERVDKGNNDTFYIKSERNGSGNYQCKVRKKGQSSDSSVIQQVTIIAAPVLSVRGGDATLHCGLSSAHQSPGSFVLYRDREVVLEQRVPGGDQTCAFNFTLSTTHGQQGEYSCSYYTQSPSAWVFTEQSEPVSIPVHGPYNWIAIGGGSAAALLFILCLAVLCILRVKRGPTSNAREQDLVYATLNPDALRKKDPTTPVVNEEPLLYAAVVVKEKPTQ